MKGLLYCGGCGRYWFNCRCINMMIETKKTELGFKLMAKAILGNATSYRWSLQGLGMFRLYLSQELRMHVWDPDFAFPGASPMHTHPWDFTSYIVAGGIVNERYSQYNMDCKYGELYNKALLKCGEGGCMMDEKELVKLYCHQKTEHYEGQWYGQSAEEIHWSKPQRGTVTLVYREFRPDLDRDHAYVFWPDGQEWGTAEPRAATHDEVQRMSMAALGCWFRD